jgi:UDP-glucose 4-epimerase
MAGMRILVSGMGGELGTRVTNLLEELGSVEAVVGFDLDPPRHRIPRAEFHRIDPRDRKGNVAVVRDFEPNVVVHLGVYEPNARFPAEDAREATHAAAISVLGAASQSPALERIVLRSGIEVYGRARNFATRPDESISPRPTDPFGRSLLELEAVAADAAQPADVPVTALRFAPLVGPHFPSPLGRYLRLPVVPVSAVSDLPFSLLHQEDAAQAIVAAVGADHDGPVNVVGAGAVTAVQACRLGGRVPVPVGGPLWTAARMAAELLGAPLPAHVHQLLVRGRTADGSLVGDALGITPSRTTLDVVKELYEWAPVTYLDTSKPAAA